MIFAICLISALSVVTFLCGLKIGHRLGKKGRYSLLIVSLLIGIGYVFFLRDGSLQILLIRNANTIFYGKWLLIITGFAAGVLTQISSVKMWKRTVLVLALLAVSSMDLFSYFIYPRPDGGNVTEKWLCMQTTESTCSAAAAASLLRIHGIEVSEKEMIRVCLSTIKGTPWQGVWRGVNLYAPPEHKVVLIRGIDSKNIEFPMLISAEFDSSNEEHTKYVSQWGWKPGTPHSVVLFERTKDGYLTVGDPSIGIDRWDDEALEVLWNGQGIVLKKNFPDMRENSDQ
ncbi:MAG: hypothetical protein GWN67_03200 [Phycisphaerae bacterium]|nr:hypothetical protein [Phycisphaerae bacterium]NIP50967.1 hypothetical protein [Phycisphaerae bacterium]NIS50157.1 hypothetical protein [Phycisphaerae bacterium]NIU07800.1 hypothetical protein [Phycisphaerae bacterium]NIU55423.1 hypothetical protein [Phycisphaerae bacterium]